MNNSGVLYIVATPIGNLDDLSARAVKILQLVDYIATEDTRHSGHLLSQFAIAKKLISLHEHNEAERIEKIIADLQRGQSVAVVSDAGTPLISDPGYRLVKVAREQGIKVVPIPGACALIAALSVAGLPSDRFVFEGFLPAKSSARQQRLQGLIHEERTLIFYESPHRIIDLLEDMISVWGGERLVVLARELTKTYETVISGVVQELKRVLLADSNQQKGEFVVLAQGAEPREKEAVNTEHLLKALLEELPVNQATRLAAKISGEKKNKLYEMALVLKR